MYISNRTEMERVRISCKPMPYSSALVVDNNKTNIFIMKGLLSPYELKIDSALSGFEAIGKIENGSVYDIIFMDQMMPKLDGVETTKRLRARGYINPIVALTANTIAGLTDKLPGNGFDDIISKPVNISQLDCILNKLVQKKQLPDFNKNTEQQTRKKQNSTFAYDKMLLLNNEIKGLDVLKGFERYNGNKKAYTSILRLYSTDIRALIGSIEDVDEKGLNDYRIKIHGIKGASLDIYAYQVGKTAAGLERAAIDGELGYIKKHNPLFLKATHEFLDRLDRMIVKIDAGYQKPVKEKPDIKLLSKLLKACNEFDIDGADAVIADLEKYRYRHDNELVDWLSENVEMTNFTEIEKKLECWSE